MKESSRMSFDKMHILYCSRVGILVITNKVWEDVSFVCHSCGILSLANFVLVGPNKPRIEINEGWQWAYSVVGDINLGRVPNHS